MRSDVCGSRLLYCLDTQAIAGGVTSCHRGTACTRPNVQLEVPVLPSGSTTKTVAHNTMHIQYELAGPRLWLPSSSHPTSGLRTTYPDLVCVACLAPHGFFNCNRSIWTADSRGLKQNSSLGYRPVTLLSGADQVRARRAKRIQHDSRTITGFHNQ
jgi:hypothetical protein